MRHRELDNNGEGLCSVPMWRGGMPAGFCDQPAFGLQTTEGKRKYDGYVPGLACFGHGGPEFRVFKDGDKFCAVKRDFEDLVQSPAGFGDTPEEARQELVADIERHRAGEKLNETQGELK
jgi:hypothetical protein